MIGRKGSQPKEPMWKRRLESQIKGMRRDLSRVEALLRIQGRTAQRKFYLELSGDKSHSEPTPDAVMAKHLAKKRHTIVMQIGRKS